ncbi:MAG TPA: dephospho-CoA kinase, partial [Vicinamibacteria bacterium]|nr:dephospho-CoA kinase [Vicinamibacteria bacterium]
MLRVGLTGGIGCGKSHVLRRLAAQGFATLDLDAAAREVTAPGSPALAEITAEFGTDILGHDGALDRPALGKVVFADAAARARLNAIVHPRVRAAEARWARALTGREGAVLVTD